MRRFNFSANVFLPLRSAVSRPTAALASRCLFNSFKVFPALCGKQKHFLYRLMGLSMGSCFINQLLKSSWAEKRFDRVMLQAGSEESAKASRSHLAASQTFSRGEIRNNAGV